MILLWPLVDPSALNEIPPLFGWPRVPRFNSSFPCAREPYDRVAMCLSPSVVLETNSSCRPNISIPGTKGRQGAAPNTMRL